MKKKNIIVFALSVVLVACLIYGVLRVMMIRQRRVNLDASMKYANIVSQDISDVCYIVDVTDDAKSYEDASYVNCYFSSDKNDKNMARIAVDSNGVIVKVSYYSLVDTRKMAAINIDDLNEKISKLSGALMTTRVKLKYGDFVNINKIPVSMSSKIESSDYKKSYSLVSSGNEENELKLKYNIDSRTDFKYFTYEIY